LKLLFDHNLSPKLAQRLADHYPESAHVSTLGLDRARDYQVWTFAHENGFTIVTRDADYQDLITLEGFPPKVIWIRRGNCSTSEIEALLRDGRDALQTLAGDDNAGLLTLL
jgi:predicted nuclease of predicted toxin-antitoxin system